MCGGGGLRGGFLLSVTGKGLLGFFPGKFDSLDFQCMMVLYLVMFHTGRPLFMGGLVGHFIHVADKQCLILQLFLFMVDLHTCVGNAVGSLKIRCKRCSSVLSGNMLNIGFCTCSTLNRSRKLLSYSEGCNYPSI